jgi:hypothetical protein
MTTVTKYTTPTAAGAEIDRRAERYMAEHKTGYTEAWHAIIAADKQLAEAYAQPAARRVRMATTDPRSQPAVPVSPAEEREVLDWVLRALQDGKAGVLPGALGQLSIEAARFKKTGMPVEEAAKRAMDLFPHLVARSKTVIDDLRRNAPTAELSQGRPDYVVHLRAQEKMKQHPELDYRMAVGAVLSEDRELKVAYAGVKS